ncbi:hypothetical protein [Isoptericola sp. QY 916]|uniref:hypothetical protein n=1 Tax=Isoptericola sp. QY 916 TaxID=2782570 RepID=UPI003D2FEE90|nr:hypothetical protein [Isoptericola sp. QY 916]
MTTVLVHPSRGAKDGRINLQQTLEKYVDIGDPVLAAALTSEQRTELLARHPSGKVHFWGTYEANRQKIMRVNEGDVVVFTGQGAGWAIGVVGYRFENEAFAKEIWVEHPEKGAYSHIYSLTYFAELELPYAFINQPLGLNPANHFQSMAVYDDIRGARLLDALLDVHPSLAPDVLDASDRLVDELLENDDKVDLKDIEDAQVGELVYTVEAGERFVRRGENALVRTYAATLGSDAQYGREYTKAGVTDLQVQINGSHELIEAKSSSDTASVRQVIAQLLHYAPSVKHRPHRVAGLFPARPVDEHVALLNKYGIDVIYRVSSGHFNRVEAEESRRTALRAFWD